MDASRNRPARGWARASGSVRASLACSGTTHTILLRRGSLRLLDHDLSAERALVALGGDVPVCVQVYDAWRTGLSHEAEAYPLLRELSRPGARRAALLPEPKPDPLAGLEGRIGGRLSAAMLQPGRPQIWSKFAQQWRHTVALSIPRELRDAIGAAACVHVLRNLGGGMPLCELDEYVAAKATAAAAEIGFRVTVELVRRPRAAGLAASEGGGVRLLLPEHWVPAVWARGLARIDDLFVLDASPGPGPDIEVTAADLRDPSGTFLATVRRREGGWSIVRSG